MFEDAEIISSYSRAQAIEDGVLVDLTEKAKGYFKFPVAFTSTLWSVVEKAVANEKYCNDIEGVLHDIFWQAKVKATSDPVIRFAVIITGAGRSKVFALKYICGPGDTPEPVLTFMMGDED